MRPFYILILTIYSLNIKGQPASFDTVEWQNLKSQIGQDSIVGLGETGHGFESINEVKSAVVDFLRSELNFQIISFESSFTESIISFLYSDSLDKRTKMFLYPFWNTNSVKRFLNNFSTSGNAHSKPFIVGFDIQEDCRYKEFSEFLKRRNLSITSLDKLDESDSILSYYIGKEFSRKHAMTDEEYRILMSNYDLVTLELDKQTIDILQKKLLKRCIDNRKWLCKYLTFSSSSRKMYYRDSLMAANIVWLKNELYNHDKLIVWAADTHVSKRSDSKKPEWTGEWLSSIYPDNYFTISFQKGSTDRKFPLAGTSLRYFEGSNKKFDIAIYLDKLRKINAHEWLTQCD